MRISVVFFLSLLRFTFEVFHQLPRVIQAAKNGDHATVREILQTDLPPISIINDALISASSEGHFDVVTILVDEAGANVNATDDHNRNTPLNWAADQGHVDIVRFLIEKKVDVNHVDTHGRTALMMASLVGLGTAENIGDYFEIVKILIENKADVNKVDQYGDTALSLAVEQQSAEVVELLVSAGADTSSFAESELVNEVIRKLHI